MRVLVNKFTFECRFYTLSRNKILNHVELESAPNKLWTTLFGIDNEQNFRRNNIRTIVKLFQ